MVVEFKISFLDDKKISDLQRRLDTQYDKIDEVEEAIADLKSQVYELKKNQIDADSIYGFLNAFNELYAECTDAEKKQFMQAFIERIDIFPESREDGNWIRNIRFQFPVPILRDGKEVVRVDGISLDKEKSDEHTVTLEKFPTLETVCLLSKLHEAKYHVNVRLDMDELDLTSAESKATYEKIKKYVAEHNDGMKVSNLYIAQVKAKYGIIERENYNLPKSEDAKQPQCPKKKEDAEAIRAGKLKPTEIKEEDRDYYLERRYPAFGNLCPRDIASRAAKERCDAGYGVGTGNAVYLDFSDAINRLGEDVIAARYGNLFQMYEMITDDNPYKTPMMIFPASHYTMGGIWVDYELQTSVKGLFAIGEANFSDHGGNRLGASALMQGLADGYFVLPYTMQNYLSDQIKVKHPGADAPEFVEAEKKVRARIERLMNIKGKRSADSIHKELGLIMWNLVGMGRTAEGLIKAIEQIDNLKKEFDTNLFVPGEADTLNVELEKALRLEDFFTIGRLMAIDALHRNESCGAHFREEYQTEDGEAQRRDDQYMYVSCWKYAGEGEKPILLKEPLNYEAIKVQTRNYKS